MAADDKLAKTPQPTDLAPAGWFYRLSATQVLCGRPPTQPVRASDQVLIIKSGKAFPLGHPTTRLCLDLLTGALAERPGGSLVEVGCGTGVICIAAAALGVSAVTGVDLARRAVRVTRQNARNNGLADVITVVQGSTECLKARFDLVMANLPWEVQLAKVPELDRLAAAGGRLILSGFRDNQEEPLLKQYQRLGWTVQRRLVKYFDHPELPPQISFNWVAWVLAEDDRAAT